MPSCAFRTFRLLRLGIAPSVLSSALVAALLTIGPLGAAGNDSDDWLSRVQQRIADSEYQVTWREATSLENVSVAWHAPNRAHDFRTYFVEEGIRVVPRQQVESSWHWGLSLIGYGRGEQVSPVAAAKLTPVDNRIDYDRGEVVEWYVNDRRGLEQGFTLTAPPEEVARSRGHLVAGAEGEPAHLVLGLSGNLSAVFAADGQAIDFMTPADVRAVRYAELRVYDADGRELAAWMEATDHQGLPGIRLVFEDAVAVYPVTIDPLVTSSSWSMDGGQADTYYGAGLKSVSGDVNGDGYDDVIVGAHEFDSGEANEGWTFVYYGTASGLDSDDGGSGCLNSADWCAESNYAGAHFGTSVSTAGDVNGDGYDDVIVGAYALSHPEAWEGGVYAFYGSANGLDHDDGGSGCLATADWCAESNRASARFGQSVSTAGDVNGDGYDDVIVGAPYYNDGQTGEGLAFVYYGTAGGLNNDTGGSGCPAGADWCAASDQANADYGYSVSTAGDVNGDGYDDVIVGARYYNDGLTREGWAFVYYGTASGLNHDSGGSGCPAGADWCAESDQASAEFGGSVSAAGDVNADSYDDVIVGARYYESAPPPDHTDEGWAFVYYGTASGLDSDDGGSGCPAGADWCAESDQASAHHGNSVSTAGDVNADGCADVIIGTVGYDKDGWSDAGRASVYCGSVSGLSPDAAWAVGVGQSSAYFGSSVSAAGDVNADGHADVIVGAPSFDLGLQRNYGMVFVFHGGVPEINDGIDNQCNGLIDEIDRNCGFHDSADTTDYSWTAQSGATSYEVARSTVPDFVTDCVRITTSDSYWNDYEPLPQGTCFYYLVRALAPHTGSWGRDSEGVERVNVCQ